MKKLLLAGLLSGLACLSFAAGDAEAGAGKVAVCASCHGADGIATIKTYPNLKGQNEEYLALALTGYKTKERKGLQAATMYAMVAALSEQDILDIAAYYANLE